MFLGLRTVVYPAPDLAASKAWWSEVLGVQPYFDEAFYVGFNPGGYELGLDPNADPSAGPRTYWGVRDIEAAGKHMITTGAVVVEAVSDVGDGIRLGTFRSPAGYIVGLIENPQFELRPVPVADGAGRLPGAEAEEQEPGLGRQRPVVGRADALKLGQRRRLGEVLHGEPGVLDLFEHDR